MGAVPRCVLIDDDPDFLTMATPLVRAALPPWEVLPFQNSLEALVYILDHHANLVVTDFRMPEMDGLVLASHLRSAGIAIPVLVISGNAIEAQALAAGATAFLSKVKLPSQLGRMLVSLGFDAGNRPALQVRSV